MRLSGLASRRALAAGAVHAGHRCARGCKALYGATGAGFVSEERKGKQRATFPIINKAAAPSILMRQGGKNQRLGSQYTMGYNRDLAFFFKRRTETQTEGNKEARLERRSERAPPRPSWKEAPVLQPQLSEKCQGSSAGAG